MKNILAIICLLLCFMAQSRAQMVQVHTMKPDAERLVQIYEVLRKNPMAVNSQLAYLKYFPKTKDDFIGVFNPDDYKTLYKVSHDYINVLKDIGTNFPDSVLRIGIGIGKQLEWSSGPSEDLQHVLLSVASEHIESFVNEVYLLKKKKELHGIVGYLADVEQAPMCAIYRDLVHNLDEAGAYNLAGMLTRAKGTSH